MYLSAWFSWDRILCFKTYLIEKFFWNGCTWTHHTLSVFLIMWTQDPYAPPFSIVPSLKMYIFCNRNKLYTEWPETIDFHQFQKVLHEVHIISFFHLHLNLKNTENSNIPWTFSKTSIKQGHWKITSLSPHSTDDSV